MQQGQVIQAKHQEPLRRTQLKSSVARFEALHGVHEVSRVAIQAKPARVAALSSWAEYDRNSPKGIIEKPPATITMLDDATPDATWPKPEGAGKFIQKCPSGCWTAG